MPKDIVVVEENTAGEDYFIGDLHGGAEQLKQVLEKLTESDRLFLVGDLGDRGPGSFEVYVLIMEANHARIKAGLPPQIHVTRGNHEDMLLEFYKVKDDPSNPMYQNFLLNGGEWATKLDEATLKKIVDYIASLPYITHAKGMKPFNVVHADMPFNDAELQARIKSGKLDLTEEEKSYATWARPEGPTAIKDTQRTADETITYCGHTIGDGVRQKTNHVNLDIATFLHNTTAMVAHHKTTCTLVGDMKDHDAKFSSGKSIKSIQGEISFQLLLNQHKVLTQLVKPILESKSLSAEAKAEEIDAILTAFSGYHHRKECRPLRECQQIYLQSLISISKLLDPDTATELSSLIGNNKLHLLRFKDATNDKAFTFFSQREVQHERSNISKAISVLGFNPRSVILRR